MNASLNTDRGTVFVGMWMERGTASHPCVWLWLFSAQALKAGIDCVWCAAEKQVLLMCVILLQVTMVMYTLPPGAMATPGLSPVHRTTQPVCGVCLRRTLFSPFPTPKLIPNFSRKLELCLGRRNKDQRLAYECCHQNVHLFTEYSPFVCASTAGQSSFLPWSDSRTILLLGQISVVGLWQ